MFPWFSSQSVVEVMEEIQSKMKEVEDFATGKSVNTGEYSVNILYIPRNELVFTEHRDCFTIDQSDELFITTSYFKSPAFFSSNITFTKQYL